MAHIIREFVQTVIETYDMEIDNALADRIDRWLDECYQPFNKPEITPVLLLQAYNAERNGEPYEGVLATILKPKKDFWWLKTEPLGDALVGYLNDELWDSLDSTDRCDDGYISAEYVESGEEDNE